MPTPRTKRLKEYALGEIASGVETGYGVTLKEIRKKGKGRDIMLGRKLLCLVAREYGYKEKEIAGYIPKDPVVATRYLKEKEDLEAEIEKVIEKIKRADINNPGLNFPYYSPRTLEISPMNSIASWRKFSRRLVFGR